MGIGYNVEANDGELYNRPRIYCDWCERPIEDARDGNVYWYHDRQETLYFNHKRARGSTTTTSRPVRAEARCLARD